ncbi:hypothetical protein GCM10010124_38370 [Pilimelia terevasa]|uniref:Uncharacterized protein n=1 Tax=Pilimelia terevasa TaxID=53372 RepID=A0A8J3FKN4_9ACTN|nr:hypothetical protein [Pilimelia terevasa]GGK41887.1 hypothetical protein GCM10010124_38370 [Pilimelia terevasa]
MTTRDTEFELILRGRADALMLALIAEYDLSDTAAEMILHKVVVNRGTLDGLLVRAQALGVDIARLRILEPRSPTLSLGEPGAARANG